MYSGTVSEEELKFVEYVKDQIDYINRFSPTDSPIRPDVDIPYVDPQSRRPFIMNGQRVFAFPIGFGVDIAKLKKEHPNLIVYGGDRNMQKSGIRAYYNFGDGSYNEKLARGVVIREVGDDLLVKDDMNITDGDIRDISPEDMEELAGSFDRGLCKNLFHHISRNDRGIVLERAHRLLNKDGIYRISTISGTGLQNIGELIELVHDDKTNYKGIELTPYDVHFIEEVAKSNDFNLDGLTPKDISQDLYESSFTRHSIIVEEPALGCALVKKMTVYAYK